MHTSVMLSSTNYSAKRLPVSLQNMTVLSPCYFMCTTVGYGLRAYHCVCHAVTELWNSPAPCHSVASKTNEVWNPGACWSAS